MNNSNTKPTETVEQARTRLLDLYHEAWEAYLRATTPARRRTYGDRMEDISIQLQEMQEDRQRTLGN